MRRQPPSVFRDFTQWMTMAIEMFRFLTTPARGEE
jgi:hypothetical protein